ncbi:MAG TPA: histidine phosphatase family protein [Ktedonobacterales bacterium]
MRLFIARHGECRAQVEPASADNGDTPLTEHGRQQAHDLGRRLAGERISHIIASPLARALETASIVTASVIAETAGDRRAEVWPDLREGMRNRFRFPPRADLMARYPLADLPSEFDADGREYAADTVVSLRERAEGVLARMRERFGEGDRLVVVTHGGFYSVLLHAILGIPPERMCWFDFDNCALTVVSLKPETGRVSWPLYPTWVNEVAFMNDHSHLTT